MYTFISASKFFLFLLTITSPSKNSSYSSSYVYVLSSPTCYIRCYFCSFYYFIYWILTSYYAGILAIVVIGCWSIMWGVDMVGAEICEWSIDVVWSSWWIMVFMCSWGCCCWGCCWTMLFYVISRGLSMVYRFICSSPYIWFVSCCSCF